MVLVLLPELPLALCGLESIPSSGALASALRNLIAVSPLSSGHFEVCVVCLRVVSAFLRAQYGGFRSEIAFGFSPTRTVVRKNRSTNF